MEGKKKRQRKGNQFKYYYLQSFFKI